MALRPESTREPIMVRSEPAASGSDVARAVRVVFVGDHEIIAKGVEGILSQHRDRAELVGHLLPSEDILEGASQLDADVILLESSPQHPTSLNLLAENRSFPIVAFTDDADERHLFEALRRGAAGYLLKSMSGAQLVDHLVLARNGAVVVDPTMAAEIAVRHAHEGNGQVWPGSQFGLSQRESQVLALLADGLSNRRIASQLIVGDETVKTHLRNLYRKLGVKDRTQAVALAIRKGIVN